MRLTTVLLTICAAAFCCRAARAETIIFRMTGTIEVSNPDNLLPAEIVTGIPFTAFMTYDLSTPDSLPDDPSLGSYLYLPPTTPNGLVLMTAGHTFETVPTNGFKVSVGNDRAGEPFSGPIDFFSLGTADVSGPGEVDFRQAGAGWIDSTGTAFSSDALPTELRPEDFDNPTIRIEGTVGFVVGGNPAEIFTITAHVAEVTIVPEPATGLLVGISAIGFFLFLISQRRAREQIDHARNNCITWT